MLVFLFFRAKELERLGPKGGSSPRRDGDGLAVVANRKPHEYQVGLIAPLSAVRCLDGQSKQPDLTHLGNAIVVNQLMSAFPGEDLGLNFLVRKVTYDLVETKLLFRDESPQVVVEASRHASLVARGRAVSKP